MTVPSDLPIDAGIEPRASLTLYAAMLDHLHEGVYLLQTGVFRYVNRSLATMAGGRPEDIVGRPLTDMIAPEDHVVVADRYRPPTTPTSLDRELALVAKHHVEDRQPRSASGRQRRPSCAAATRRMSL
jgi:PAS domain S-box-containing protein